jgi:hypothetical protein
MQELITIRKHECLPLLEYDEPGYKSEALHYLKVIDVETGYRYLCTYVNSTLVSMKKL